MGNMPNINKPSAGKGYVNALIKKKMEHNSLYSRSRMQSRDSSSLNNNPPLATSGSTNISSRLNSVH